MYLVLHLFLACSYFLGNKLPNFEFCISSQLKKWIFRYSATLRWLLPFLCILIPSDLLLLTKFVIVATELPGLIPLT